MLEPMAPFGGYIIKAAPPFAEAVTTEFDKTPRKRTFEPWYTDFDTILAN